MSIFVPAKRGEWPLFSLMFLVVGLLSFAYQILRNTKAALVVTAAASGAMAIPQIQLWALLPATVVATWLLARLLRLFTAAKVFVAITASFLFYFIAFVAWLYPYRSNPVVFSSFFVMAELWKVVVLSILFWGFLNRHLVMEKARRFYASLALAGGVGMLVAGPITALCMSDSCYALCPLGSDRWHHGLIMVTAVAVGAGVAALLLFRGLARRLTEVKRDRRPTAGLSLMGSLSFLLQSRYLLTFSLLIIADYLVFTLAEVLFMDVLRYSYPDPTLFTRHMAWLSMIGSGGTLLLSLFIAPVIFRRFPWVVAALVTPVTFALVTAAFFGSLLLGAPPAVSVMLGSVMFCTGRIGKFGLLDPAKELAFVPLSNEAQVKGKLIIDGLVGRAGRGGSSLAALGLVAAFGSLAAALPAIALVAAVGSAIWIRATRSLGKEMSAVADLVDQDVAQVG